MNLLDRIAGTACCLLFLATCPVSNAFPDKVQRDDRIGVCTHFAQNWSVEEIMPVVARSGVGWIRDDLHWAELEPRPGNYQIPQKTRNWIQAARKAGLKIDLVFSYGNPAYADHYDTDAYAKAAGWLAHEVGDSVQAIEVLNEPNNYGFRDTYGGAWNGNEPNGSVSPYLQKYVQLLNAAAKEIKLANPRMTVIGLGAPAPANFRMIALGLAPEVDGLTDHPYPARLPELVPYDATPSMLQRDGIATADSNGTFPSQVGMYRTQAKRFGATEKLWHTEWGYSTVRPKRGQTGMSEEMQADYILRRLLESIAVGVDHTFIYVFKDESDDPYSSDDNFGLIHNDRSRKQAFFALERLTGLLAGMAPAEKKALIENHTALGQEGLGHRCYTFSNSERGRYVVAFWDAVPLAPNAVSSEVLIQLPLTAEPHHVYLCDLLSGKQINAPWTWSKDHRVCVSSAISGAPQSLIVD
jgi:hypothetical protein